MLDKGKKEDDDDSEKQYDSEERQSIGSSFILNKKIYKAEELNDENRKSEDKKDVKKIIEKSPKERFARVNIKC